MEPAGSQACNARCRQHCASGQRIDDSAPRLLSSMQLKRAVRAGCESFLVSINKVDEEQTGGPHGSGPTSGTLEPLQDIPNAHKDVFPDGLPPDRSTGLTIPLEPGSKPTFGPVYKLSPAEKREVERQVTEYL